MKASVIIPAYNEEKYIENTIQALLIQTYPDFEIIVIDNNSTDKTKDKARALGVIVVEEKRKGTLWACERGRKIATGEVIVRLDADCIPDRDWLEKGMRYFNDEDVAAVGGIYDYFDGSKSFKILSSFMQKYIYSLLSWFLQVFKIGALLIGGNSFMRQSMLEKIGGFDTSITFYGDDTDTAKRLSKVGKVIFDNKIVVKSSVRRFNNEGVVKISLMYFFYFFRTLFRGKK